MAVSDESQIQPGIVRLKLPSEFDGLQVHIVNEIGTRCRLVQVPAERDRKTGDWIVYVRILPEGPKLAGPRQAG